MTPEGRVKADIKKWLKDNDVWYYMPLQNGMGRVGIPDFICCWEGYFIAIEAKAPGKERCITPNQQLCMSQIRDAKGVAIVVSNVDQLIENVTALRVWQRMHS